MVRVSGLSEQQTPIQKKRKLEAKSPCFTKKNCMQAAKRAKKCRLLSMVILIFDLDLQTRRSEGPNTSSMWISSKSIQWLRIYFIHKQKTRDCWRQKQNLPQFTAVHCVWQIPVPLIIRGSLPEQVEEDYRDGTSDPRFTWRKKDIKT